jgi:hypothetical protein
MLLNIRRKLGLETQKTARSGRFHLYLHCLESTKLLENTHIAHMRMLLKRCGNTLTSGSKFIQVETACEGKILSLPPKEVIVD